MSLRPVFVFCQPRSGSTLVQRVLAAHRGVATTSEPWFLLPFLYTLRPDGIDPRLERDETARAIREFSAQLPGGEEDFREALRAFVLEIYRRAAGPDATVFLDKTPLYHLVAPQIADLFPEARLVVLWRNPLSVAVSATETFGYGRWKPQDFGVDLFHGVDNLLRVSERHPDRTVSVRYEDLVGGDQSPWRRLADHVGVDFEPAALTAFRTVDVPGDFKDPVGTQRYGVLSTEPLEKWKASVTNPVRKAWMAHYLRRLGPERIRRMGYAPDALAREVAALEVGTAGLRRDLVDLARSALRRPLRDYGLSQTFGAGVWRHLYDRRAGGPNDDR